MPVGSMCGSYIYLEHLCACYALGFVIIGSLPDYVNGQVGTRYTFFLELVILFISDKHNLR